MKKIFFYFFVLLHCFAEEFDVQPAKSEIQFRQLRETMSSTAFNEKIGIGLPLAFIHLHFKHTYSSHNGFIGISLAKRLTTVFFPSFYSEAMIGWNVYKLKEPGQLPGNFYQTFHLIQLQLWQKHYLTNEQWLAGSFIGIENTLANKISTLPSLNDIGIVIGTGLERLFKLTNELDASLALIGDIGIGRLTTHQQLQLKGSFYF